MKEGMQVVITVKEVPESEDLKKFGADQVNTQTFTLHNLHAGLFVLPEYIRETYPDVKKIVIIG